eukprot:scaffold111976_cov48-Phaeocystis_antarctica.AAC.1
MSPAPVPFGQKSRRGCQSEYSRPSLLEVHGLNRASIKPSRKHGTVTEVGVQCLQVPREFPISACPR